VKNSLIGRFVLTLAACVFGAGVYLGNDRATAATDSNLNEIIAAAQKEGELNILQASFGDPQMWSKVQAAVNAKYRINVKLNGRPGPSSASLAPRLIEEVRAGRKPSSDITLNPPIQQMALDQAEALVRVNWRELDPSIPEDAVTKSGTGLIVGGSLIVAVYNTNLIPKASAPKTLNDLRDPRYKGLIATSPYAGAWPPVASWHGVGEVESFLKEISSNGNLKGFIPLTDQQRIASGEFAILLFTDSKARADATIAQGAPLATTTLGMNMAFTYSVNIVKGTPSPNLAKLVGLFFASREGQAILSEYTTYDSAYLPGSATYEALQAAKKRGEKVVIENEAFIVDNPQIYLEFSKAYSRLVGAR
jgi:iron(III) transport system substrate-binding protein